MTQEQKIENNKLIAEFMGGKKRYFIEEKYGTWWGEKISNTPHMFHGAVIAFSIPTNVNGKQLTKPMAIQHYAWQLTPKSVMWVFDQWLKYHESWDWLMPVVKNIKDYLQNLERPSRNHCCKGDMIEVDIQCHLWSIDIEKTWASCVDFINWYNEKQVA